MNVLLVSPLRRLFVLVFTTVLSVPFYVSAKEVNDLVFIHHSSGENWLNSGLHNALLAKEYIDERNDITYGTVVPSDKGRPASLGDVPGDNTNMNHWILWFNDYLGQVKQFGCSDGYNRIVMFKSCFPISDVNSDGTEPGDPFNEDQTLANYKAIYRHPGGPNRTYSNNKVPYFALEDIFSKHPEILFIPVTAPPLCYGGTNNAYAHRARIFNTWLKTEWLSSYRKAHPGLMNVAVFDWFDFLANPDNYPVGPNRLKAAYGGTGDDSHPNETANAASTVLFATGPNNFLDASWLAFSAASTAVEGSDQRPAPQAFRLDSNYPNPFNLETTIRFDLPTAAHVRLSIYNSMGREIAVLVDGSRSEGTHQVGWDGLDVRSLPVSAGMYLVRLEADSYHGIGRMLLLK